MLKLIKKLFGKEQSNNKSIAIEEGVELIVEYSSRQDTFEEDFNSSVQDNLNKILTELLKDLHFLSLSS